MARCFVRAKRGERVSYYKLSGYNSCATVGNFTLVSLYRWEGHYAAGSVPMQTGTPAIVFMKIFSLCVEQK